jgi:hypothetical protein
MNRSQRKLDDLLQAWTRRRAADAPTLERLTARILADCSSLVPESGGQAGDLVGRPATARLRQSPAWLVAAVSLLIALGLGYATARLGGWNPSESPAEDAVPAFAQLDPSALRTAATLVSELESLFDQRLQWVAESGGQVRLEIAEPGELVGAQPTVVLRIVAIQRDLKGKTARLLWTAQVVGGDQQVVRLEHDVAGSLEEPRLQVWAFALPDGRIMVDSEFRLAGPMRLHVASGGVQDSGIPTKVYASRQGDSEFEVYQTVALLKDKVS